MRFNFQVLAVSQAPVLVAESAVANVAEAINRAMMVV
jgi:hypothetical protein